MSASWGSDHWERVASETRWGSYIDVVEHRAVDLGSRLAAPSSTALDFGCGSGRWSEQLDAQGWHMSCVDVDTTVLATCRERVPGAECSMIDPDATTLPAPTASIRLLLCLEVFEVVHEQWFVDEVARVVEPGGVIVVTVSNATSYRRVPFWLRTRLAGSRRSDRVYSAMYSVPYRSWRQRLRSHGFNFVFEEGICWAPFSRESNSVLIPAATALERIVGLRRLPVVSPWVVAVAQRR